MDPDLNLCSYSTHVIALHWISLALSAIFWPLHKSGSSGSSALRGLFVLCSFLIVAISLKLFLDVDPSCTSMKGFSVYIISFVLSLGLIPLGVFAAYLYAGRAVGKFLQGVGSKS